MTLTVLVDDRRSFVDGREAVVLRTSQDAFEWLFEHRDAEIDELWLDHDLGPYSDEDIGAVIWLLELGADAGEPFKIGQIYVHTANPGGRDMMMRALKRWNYNVVSINADWEGILLDMEFLKETRGD